MSTTRTATVTVDNYPPRSMPRGAALGYATFINMWGDPYVRNVACVGDDDDLPVTRESLTPRELLEAHLKSAELGAKYYGTQAAKADASALVTRYQAEIAALDAT